MKKIKNILYAFLPTILILFSIELCGRIYYSSKNADWQYILYGIKQTPLGGATKTRILNLEESKKNNTYYKEYVNHKSDTSYQHVFCVGASTTVGNDIENNYPRYLNKKLKKHIDQNILVHIVGKGHINSNHFMDMILVEMEYASPNLIILYCGYNDLFNHTITVSKSKSKLLSIIISLEKYSLFTKIAKEKFYVLKKESEAQEQQKSNHEMSLEIFKKNIQKLTSYTTTTKINLILIPDVLDARKFSGITKTYDDFDKKNNDIQIALKDVSEDNENVFYLNLYHLFDFENKVNDVHSDVAHLTNKGYNTLSEGIFNFIIEKKVFKTK